MASFITRMATSSPATPATAKKRAGPACSTGVVSMASPPEARDAELANTKARCPCISCHVGTAVSLSSMAV